MVIDSWSDFVVTIALGSSLATVLQSPTVASAIGGTLSIMTDNPGRPQPVDASDVLLGDVR